MFYLTTQSTHFSYGYMVSNLWYRTTQRKRKPTVRQYKGLVARVHLDAPSHRQVSTYHGIFLHQKWRTGPTMRDRSDNLLHHDILALPKNHERKKDTHIYIGTEREREGGGGGGVRRVNDKLAHAHVHGS